MSKNKILNIIKSITYIFLKNVVFKSTKVKDNC